MSISRLTAAGSVVGVSSVTQSESSTSRSSELPTSVCGIDRFRTVEASRLCAPNSGGCPRSGPCRSPLRPDRHYSSSMIVRFSISTFCLFVRWGGGLRFDDRIWDQLCRIDPDALRSPRDPAGTRNSPRPRPGSRSAGNPAGNRPARWGRRSRHPCRYHRPPPSSLSGIISFAIARNSWREAAVLISFWARVRVSAVRIANAS